MERESSITFKVPSLSALKSLLAQTDASYGSSTFRDDATHRIVVLRVAIFENNASKYF